MIATARTAFSASFNAPFEVEEALNSKIIAGPLFKAVKKLGPNRVQWIGDEGRHESGKAGDYCNWSLDGKPCRAREIFRAAGVAKDDYPDLPRTKPPVARADESFETRVLGIVTNAGSDGVTTRGIMEIVRQVWPGPTQRALALLRQRNLIGTSDGCPATRGRTTHWVRL